ncbi:Alpha/beta hydrolase fold-1 [Mycena haematopus]|nr:Alpha/beta hydrolase fold-1 [Mycena haematopus]
MKSQLYISEPTPSCPFRVEGVQYIPGSPCEDGFTLIFLHAMSLHKETFQPLLEHLLATSTRIKDVWSIDNPNHGRSSVLNQKLLASSSYHHYWSAAEYARATYSFLSSSCHGVCFSSRRIVGLAHSSAVSALMMLLRDTEFSASNKPLNFTFLILLDPALLPPQFPSTTVLSNMFGKFALTKRDKWPTRAAAHQYLAAHPAFKAWDPRALRLFVDCALRDSDSSEVVLSCSKTQEAGFYLSPTADYKARPVEIFIELTRADELPIHIITCLKDEYKGQTLPSKEFQIAQVKSTTLGSVQLIEGGHMFPQAKPLLCAEAIQRVLATAAGRQARL